MTMMNKAVGAWLTGAVVLLAAACGGSADSADGAMSGAIEIDGSSTVYPITEAVAEDFMARNGRGVQVMVGYSGTGGGFKRFCVGETPISDASRPIKDSEREKCAREGVEFVDLPVAYDGISVVVNPANDFAQCLTVEELRRIWEPDSKVRLWSDVRPEWPAEEIRLYGPGTDSGTFDYFTEEIVGESGASRPDFTASEDDNVLVQGVAGDQNSLGYFGYAYYEENTERLKLVAVDSGDGCVEPERETIKSGSYAPLSRPIFIYVNRQSLQKPEVAEFVRFYMDNAAELVPQVGYVSLDQAIYQQNLQAIGTAGGAAS